MKREIIYVKSSISVYLLLMLVVLLSLIFTLLESARVRALRCQAEMCGEQNLESVFAQYHRALYDRYHLFAYEAEPELFETGELSFETERKGQFDLLYAETDTAEVTAYELFTDGQGAAFRRQVTECVEMEALGDAVAEAMSYLEEAKDKSAQEQMILQQEEDAFSAITQIEEQKKANAKETDEQETLSEEVQQVEFDAEAGKALTEKYGNPIEILSQLKKQGVLAVVVKDASELSAKTLAGQELLINREKWSRTMSTQENRAADELLEKAAYSVYVNKYFGNYTETSKENALSYEQEYLIAGKESDSENLKAIVQRLLVMREVCNYTTISQDQQKCALAQSLASALALAVGLEPLIQPLKIGILLAWSYGESILDVRTILAGGKVSFIKTTDQWTLELDQLGDLVNTEKGAKESEQGLGYTAYINLFLLLQEKEEQTMRTLSLMEQTLRQTEGNEDLCLDQLIQSMTVDMTFRAQPLFLSLVSVVSIKEREYQFRYNGSYSYLVK